MTLLEQLLAQHRQKHNIVTKTKTQENFTLKQIDIGIDTDDVPAHKKKVVSNAQARADKAYVENLQSQELEIFYTLRNKYDPDFSRFEHLFTIASPKNRKFLLPKEVEQRDKDLCECCLLLSGYFEVRVGEQALEILVNKYEMHLYNVDALMGCALCYHDSVGFVR